MLAAAISHQVQPFLDRLRIEVELQRRFKVSNVGVGEDGELLGVVGIRCEEESTMRLPSLSFGVVVTQFDASSPRQATASVTWSTPWIRNQQDGFTAYEGRLGPIPLVDGLLNEHMLSRLKVFEKRFRAALYRGHPPGVLLSYWRFISEDVPMPKVIRLTAGT